jgi:hypothetical protein
MAQESFCKWRIINRRGKEGEVMKSLVTEHPSVVTA